VMVCVGLSKEDCKFPMQGSHDMERIVTATTSEITID
jgi:hypothetical protein